MYLRSLYILFAAVSAFVFLPKATHAETLKACSITDSSKPKNCENMWAASAQIDIPSTDQIVNTPNPQCGDGSVFDYSAILQQAVQDYLTGVDPGKISGSLVKASVHYGALKLHQQTGGDITAFVWRNFSEKTDKGNCQTIPVLVPTGAKVVGYRLLMGESGGPLAVCTVGIDCGVGWSRFLKEPISPVQDGSARAYMTTAMNWSDNRQRTAKMYVFYTMPPGEVPPIPM